MRYELGADAFAAGAALYALGTAVAAVVVAVARSWGARAPAVLGLIWPVTLAALALAAPFWLYARAVDGLERRLVRRRERRLTETETQRVNVGRLARSRRARRTPDP